MSADKHKALARRLHLMRLAVAMSWVDRPSYMEPEECPKPDLHGGLLYHCEGGMAYRNADIQWLIENGYLTKLARRTPTKNFRKSFGGFSARSVLVVVHLECLVR